MRGHINAPPDNYKNLEEGIYMDEQFNEQRGLQLPPPLEQLRKAGSVVLETVFNNDAYFERMRQEQIDRKTYEDRVVSRLKERVGDLDRQDEIEHAKHKHPSNNGYL